MLTAVRCWRKWSSGSSRELWVCGLGKRNNVRTMQIHLIVVVLWKWDEKVCENLWHLPSERKLDLNSYYINLSMIYLIFQWCFMFMFLFVKEQCTLTDMSTCVCVYPSCKCNICRPCQVNGKKNKRRTKKNDINTHTYSIISETMVWPYGT